MILTHEYDNSVIINISNVNDKLTLEFVYSIEYLHDYLILTPLFKIKHICHMQQTSLLQIC